MKNIKYKILIGFLITFQLSSFIGVAQECIDFENPGSINNWKGNQGFNIANLSVISSSGTNTTNHLYFEDRSGSSMAINEVDFNGDWTIKAKDGCLCFDYRVNWNSSNATNKTGPNFIIYRIDPGQNLSNINNFADWGNFAVNGNYSGLFAYFVPNPSNPTIPKNQWNKYCLPINSNNNNLPSNTYGTWSVRQSIPGSGSTPNSVVTLSGSAALIAWNSLITNVGGLNLPADYHGNPNEEVSFDNFCWNCSGEPDPNPDPQLCCDIPDLQVKLINKTNIGGSISLNISGISTPIQNIEVSMVDYHVTYENDLCKPANLGIFGNISSPNNTVSGLVLTDNGTQSISWNPGTPGVFNGNIKLNITKPNILNLPCCNGKMYFCLKVKITDVNCNVCEKIVCGSLDLLTKTLQQHDPKDVPVDLDPTNPIGTPIPFPNEPKPIGHLNPSDVFNPITGEIWMNTNLGASQVATSSTDAAAYGDLYQWGRLTDGHEKRTSSTTTTLSSSDVPGHGNFILHPNLPGPLTWNSPQNINLWQGVNGINNPCPSGYRIPTDGELAAERLSWTTPDAAGAFASPLKWTLAGNRSYVNGQIINVGLKGSYWSSYTNGAMSSYMYFNSGGSSPSNNYQTADGASVRCIKN
ncbi:MAG: hypothetical protein CVU08_02265 [Bacteroidetes bacterium HGW-Bacteroidetes-3]|jgi:uncharacterized protein (TIGR02145 family)|nr:MAG: hypothetical protein CVU08_02265 [Bacteroidetes bacterium HGW-Bacteroidetes-3]